jgi:hypothetical protein
VVAAEEIQGHGLAAEDAENTEANITLATLTLSGTAIAAGNTQPLSHD